MAQSSTPTYKELEEKLAEIVERVEHGNYDELDKLLKDYEEGMKLLEQMEKQLETAKNKITKAVKSSSKEDG